MLNRSLIAIALIALATPALGQESRRQLDAHSHGEGRLAIAIEGKRLEMELETPASDIVGFEHAPRTKAQKQALADAKKQLAKLAGLVVLTAEAGCKLSSAKVEVEGAAAGEGKDHGHDNDHAGHDHEHEKKGAKAKADDHDHDHGDDHDHGSHSAFKVAYALECATPDKLGAVTFDYFKTFKGAQKLDVTVIGPKGQSSYVVTREKPVIDLSGVS